MPHNAVKKLKVVEPGWRGRRTAADQRTTGKQIFETIFRDLPDIVLVLDEQTGQVLEANDAVRRIIGRDPKGLIGQHFTEALPLSREASPHLLLDLVREHATVVVEWEVQRVDGSLCPMHVTAALTAWETREIVLVTLRDVSDRRRAEAALRSAEQKYRSIYENTIEGIFQTTPDGRYLSANPALARIYGYASPHALIASLTDIAGSLYVDRSRRDEFQRLLEEHDSVQGFESQVYRADGSIVWISENARAVRGADGQLRYYEGTVMDITRRRRDEEELRHLVAALGRANRLKSEFVAAISHELRTPLNIVIGYTEILLMEDLGTLTAEQRQSLEQMDRSANELLGLINQMLDLNRLDSGRLSVVSGTIHPAALFADLRAELADFIVKPGITVAWDADDGAPALDTDGARLKVILKNLIGNAIKFTDIGEVRIAAHALGNGVEIAVSDTGIGIAPEKLPIIFEPFRQVDGSMTRRYGGLGLGLHLVQRLLEVLGGTIAVQSVPGAGSTFRVWLPCGRH